MSSDSNGGNHELVDEGIDNLTALEEKIRSLLDSLVHMKKENEKLSAEHDALTRKIEKMQVNTREVENWEKERTSLTEENRSLRKKLVEIQDRINHVLSRIESAFPDE